MRLNNPYEDIKPIRDKLTARERDWYDRFIKAVDYGNFDILRQLCDEAPSDKYEELKAEITYERDRHKRETFTLPKSRMPRYSEWDYGWAEPSRLKSTKDIVELQMDFNFDYKTGRAQRLK